MPECLSESPPETFKAVGEAESRGSQLKRAAFNGHELRHDRHESSGGFDSA